MRRSSFVSNDIKMTGMPAFRDRNPPDEIVAFAVFARARPGLTVEKHKVLTDPPTRARTRHGPPPAISRTGSCSRQRASNRSNKRRNICPTSASA
jgi:hypothetical protein